MLNIALNTFREIIRNKFFYLILFFAIVFIVFSIIMWNLSIWNDSKVVTDFWLAMIEIFWLISVIFVWSQLLFNEIEWKTIYLILTKPVKKYNFILWKYLWFVLCIFIILAIESIIFILVLYFRDIQIESLVLISLFFTFIKLILLLALVFFFSTFMSNIITILTAIMVYLISQWYSWITALVYRTQNELLIKIADFVQVFFPPFEALNTKDMIWTIDELSLTYISSNIYYSLFYLIIVLIFTVLIFSHKKFES